MYTNDLKTLLSFHNDPKIKEKYLSRIRAHAKADEIIKGVYWQEGKGCAVGCTIHGEAHLSYEIELGIPQILARLEDRIFESLPNELAKTWPERFLEAIPIGKDLSKVWPKFAIFLLTDSNQCASRHPQCDIIAEKFRQQLNGQHIDWDAARASAYAAYVAASAYAASAYAAYVAAYAAYVAASTSAASAYAASADAPASAAAAYAAAYAPAYAPADAPADAARTRAYIAQSEKLLTLLRDSEEE